MGSLHQFFRLASTPRHRASGIGLATALLTCAAAAHGQEKINLQGVVVDRSTGAPIAGAHVQVRDRGATSDADGRFQLRGLVPGSHGVLASHLGYSTAVEVIELEEGSERLRIELEPNPVMMEAIQVVVDRMKSRRNALAVSVRAYEARDMLYAHTALDFLRSRVTVGRCPSSSYIAQDCVWRRGGWLSPQIYIDEVPYRFVGLDILETYPTSELHTIEVLNSGAHIRVYTKRFAERLASGRASLMPILMF